MNHVCGIYMKYFSSKWIVNFSTELQKSVFRHSGRTADVTFLLKSVILI